MTSASRTILEAARQEALKGEAGAKKASLKVEATIRKHRGRLKKAIWPALLEGFPEEEIHTLVREALVEATLRS